jgi:hypothetical protein
MMVSCARLGRVAAGKAVHVAPGPVSSPLVHAVHLAAGVEVQVDLAAPGRWRVVTGPQADATARPLLRAVLEEVPAPAPPGPLPWLRVAAADALDRWLQTPLRQSLVDAERGVTRGRAARALPPGPARAVLTGEALRLARRSSRDLGTVLRRLGRGARPLPTALSTALKNVVDGYAELADDVTGPDRELLSVCEGWRRLTRRSTGPARPVALPAADPSPPGPGRPAHMVDPRQVHARLLALAPDPAAPEITLVRTDGDDVVVRVPAFGPEIDHDLAARLLVRVVERRSGGANGHALLRPSRTEAGWFEARLPLHGLHAADVRIDVADAGSELAPAVDDADEELCEARRAVVFLAEWRRLVGLAQLGRAISARHLRGLAGRLQPSRAHTEVPLFPGGPSSAELTALADLGDDELSRRLRGEGVLGEGLRALTAGPGGLLVAELAALVLAPPR